jgi:hypothetical protein
MSTEAAPETPTPKPGEAKPTGDPPKPQEQPKPQAEAAPPVVEVDDDPDEDPKADAKGMLKQMSLKTFTARVKRMAKKDLRTMFGTDDIEKIKADLTELPTLRDFKLKVEREKMTEAERLKAEKDDALKKVAEAEARAEQAETRATVREVYGDLKAHTLTLCDKEDVEDLLDKLAGAVKRGDVDDGDAEKWLTDYVENHPKWAKKTTEEKPKPKNEEKSGKKLPITNGGKGEKTTPPAPGADAKGGLDFRTASPAEIRRATGYVI